MNTPNTTAPPVERAPMLPQPWTSFWHGLGQALRPASPVAGELPPPPWLRTARLRRRLLLASVLLMAGLGLWLAPADVHPVPLALQTLLLAWVGAGTATALAGAWVLLRGDRQALAPDDERRPIAPDARTAIVMPICNEDISTVFAGLRATCESLAATGALRLFDVYILSDTSDPAMRAAELRAWARLRRIMGDHGEGDQGRIFYRWRRRRTRRKAGNVADFCRRWGRNYRYMVVLDADSTMHGDTLVSLVRMMERHPRAGIIQTLPQSVGHDTVHARMQQFSTRVTGRLFALGMAWWQLGESHYWGHNAILRVQPFMAHCALATLPGRGGLAGDILSHDFVEAALMRRAGYEVWLAPDLGGSWEQPPPNLIAELQRDRRWCQGNLQNARLIAEPGLQPAHRAMLLTGAMSYVIAPLWLAYVALDATLGGMRGGPALWLLTLAALLLPRVLGVLTLRLAGRQHEFGGTVPLVAGAIVEALHSALQAPLRLLAHSVFVLGALTGIRLDWKSPPRDDGAVRWRDAVARVGVLTLPALAATVVVAVLQGGPSWHLWPLLLPLLVAVPFAVWSGHPRIGQALRRHGWLNTADEVQPPRTLARAFDHSHFTDLVPVAAPAAAPLAAPVARPGARRPAAPFGHGWRPVGLGLAAAMLTAVMLMPRDGVAPELPNELVAANERAALMAAAGRELMRYPRQDAEERPAPRMLVRYRPASRIDNAVRRRAMEYVTRASAESES